MEIDTRQIKRLEQKLMMAARHTFPVVVQNTLNAMAFRTRKVSMADIKDKFTLRNKFTTNSMRVTKSKTLVIDNMQSEAYSVAPYLATQEEGGVKQFTSGKNVPLLTARGAGQARGTRPRTKLAQAHNQLARLNAQRYANTGKSQPQRNMIMIHQALRRGQGRVVLLHYGRRRGLYRVYGSRRNLQIELIWDLSHKSVRIPATPFWADAANAGISSGAYFYRQNLKYQLKKAGFQ